MARRIFHKRACNTKEVCMRPIKRYAVNKHHSAKQFRAKTRTTKGMNFAAPMRGGIRL